MEGLFFRMVKKKAIARGLVNYAGWGMVAPEERRKS